jgi:hypothetical protein
VRTLLAILLFTLSANAQGIGGNAGIGGKAGIGGGFTVSAGISFIASAQACGLAAGGSGCNTVSGNSGPSSPTLNVLANDKIFVFCRANQGGVETVSDTAGDTFTYLAATVNDGFATSVRMAYIASPIANASETFTCTNGSAQNANEVIVYQLRGGVNGATLDANVQTTGSSTNQLSGSFSTVVANEVIVWCTGNSNAPTYTVGAIGSGTGTNLVQTGFKGAGCEILIVTSTQSSITALMTSTTTHFNGFLGSFE